MPPRTFRVLWSSAPTPQRTVDEDALIDEVERMARRNFADTPRGPITIEALDDQHRVSWRAYYNRAQDLASLVVLLRQEAPAA